MALIINGRAFTRPITGVERYARLLMQVVASDWPNARVIVPSSFAGDVDALGLEVVRTGRSTGHMWEQLELPRAIAPGDVLLSPANTGPLRAERHVPVIHDLAFLHHPEWFSARFATWYRLLIPRLAWRAAGVITASDHVREEVVRYFGADAANVRVVPPFPSPVLTGNSLMDTGVDRPYVLMVGSLDPRKGTARAVHWYSSLLDPQVDLVIVGRSHSAFAPTEVPVYPGIRVLEGVDDARLSSLYRNAIALVQPSLYEGFGLPLLEAMALGCPVIASELPVFRQQFGDAVTYADIGATPSMAQAMAAVTDRVTRAERIGIGRIRAATFTMDRTRSALHTVLDPLLTN